MLLDQEEVQDDLVVLPSIARAPLEVPPRPPRRRPRRRPRRPRPRPRPPLIMSVKRSYPQLVSISRLTTNFVAQFTVSSV